jgi:DUF438 domain-containing protein
MIEGIYNHKQIAKDRGLNIITRRNGFCRFTNEIMTGFLPEKNHLRKLSQLHYEKNKYLFFPYISKAYYSSTTQL